MTDTAVTEGSVADSAVAASQLTTGWESDLAPTDTVLRQFVLNLADMFGSAADASYGWTRRTPQLALADLGRPAGFYNSCVLLQPPHPYGWDWVLDDVERWYGRSGSGEVLLWSPWPTPDLTSRGWRLVGHPPLLIRQPGGRLPRQPDGLRVQPVTDRVGLEDWAAVAVDGYPFPELRPYRPGTLLGPRILADPRWRFWVGYHDDRPVAIGTSFVAYGFAQFALGVTLPEARGHGFWYGMVRQRLLATPGLLTGSVFSDDSRPGAEKLGFLPITRFTLWQLERSY